MELVVDVRPAQCTLVPDDPGQLTSDHGWDIEKHGEQLESVVKPLSDAGIRVSVFMDPVTAPMTRVKDLGADRIELYTETYASAYGTDRFDETLARFVASADAAREAGLELNAGHDLNQENLGALLDAIPDIDEVSIGHALICEALHDGFDPTVRRYVAIVSENRSGVPS
jgi:pyridoxine 5-phosphate synthase